MEISAVFSCENERVKTAIREKKRFLANDDQL